MQQAYIIFLNGGRGVQDISWHMSFHRNIFLTIIMAAVKHNSGL